MACNVIPYDRIGGNKQTGGTWKLVSGGPVQLIINGGAPTTYNNGNTIPGDHTMVINFDQTAAGPIVLEYRVGQTEPCIDTALVTINVVAKARAGQNRTVTKCSVDNANYNLYQLIAGGDGVGGTTTLQVDTDGVWSGPGTQLTPAYSPAGISPTDDTFRPSLVTIPAGQPQVSTTFTYTVTRPDADAACSNCTATATLTFVVVSQPNAGNDVSITVCNNL